MKKTNSAKRIMARRKAVSVRPLQDREVDAVTGAGSYVPTVPGADMEIFPGFWGEPWEPTFPGQSDVKTLGYNEP
ncbi:MAG: hypothetical protein ACFE0P_10870 [Oceanicaulis sp.]